MFGVSLFFGVRKKKSGAPELKKMEGTNGPDPLLETGSRFQGLPSLPPVHFNNLPTLLLTSWFVLFLLLSISSRENNMPPKKHKPNDDFDFRSDQMMELSQLLLIRIMTPSLIPM